MIHALAHLYKDKLCQSSKRSSVDGYFLLNWKVLILIQIMKKITRKYDFKIAISLKQKCGHFCYEFELPD